MRRIRCVITLGEKAKVKETVRLYSKMWQLPSFSQIILRMIVLVLIGSLVPTILKSLTLVSLNPLLTLISYLTILGAPVFVGTGLLYAIAAERNSPLDGRRAAGLVMFGLIFWYAFGIIGSILDAALAVQFFEIRLWMFGASMGFLAFAFLVNGLSDHHEIRNLAGAIMPVVLWVIVQSSVGALDPSISDLPDMWYISMAVSAVIVGAVVHRIYRSVSAPFERDLGIDGPELLRAFGHEYLSGNPEPLERILTGICTVQDVPMEIMLFADEEGPVACGVVSYIHPGPFRTIGSSDIPSAIMRHVREKYDIPCFVLHGSCTHQQNLTTKDDYAIVFDEIDRLIKSTMTYDRISGPFWTDGGKFKVWTFFAGPDALTITTSAPEFTDDIALDVGVDTADMIRSRLPDLGRVSIVDAHNCINDDAVSVTKGTPEAAEYVGTVSEAVFSTSNRQGSSVEIGIHQVVPEDISSEEGIGPGGITALVMRTGEGEFVLVSVDGNNMVPGFREEVINLLKTQGFDGGEIVTTDTHVVNAIALSSKGYPPVGKYKPEETVEHVLVACERARAQKRPVRIGFGFGEARGVRTMGEKGFDILTQDVAEAAGIAKHVGIKSGLAAFFSALVLAFLV
ncbi:MAG: hypothetical protein DRP09_06920 [Candidatus Thorarchaeota archaeon]|nr:MAG: hypothetical protein DRP09_06920 [Candidatus Thorarchaeota archaeon]